MENPNKNIIDTFVGIISDSKFKKYKRIITIRNTLNRICRIPQKTKIIKIPERVRILEDFLNGPKKPTTILVKNTLSTNMVVVHKTYKNKTIMTVKTDIDWRYLRKI